MKRYSIVLLIVLAAGLALANTMLIWQHYYAKEVTENNLSGLYAYPGIGALFVSKNLDGLPVRAPLTLAIFFSADTECSDCLDEIESYKRLIPVFLERGQKVVALTSRKDSTVIAGLLEKRQLDIPLVVPAINVTLEGMGISPLFMPFKVLYNSTLTAIYMSGANNTPESQADFEAAMLWLSEMVDKKINPVESL